MTAKVRVTLLFWFLLFSLAAEAAGPLPFVRRICADPQTRRLTAYIDYNGTRPKDVFLKVVVSGNRKSDGKEVRLDSVTTPLAVWDLDLGNFDNPLGEFRFTFEYDTGGAQVYRTYHIGRKADIIPPDPINLDSVSVQGGKAVMGWQASTAKDIKGYIIYRSVGVANNPIDTVFGQNATSAVDNFAGNPNLRPESYRIAAIDSCDNVSDLGKRDTTIHLQAILDTCKREISVQWTRYGGKPVQFETLMWSEDNGITWRGVTNLGGRSRLFTGIQSGRTYLFYLQARLANGAFSNSNVGSVSTNFLLENRSILPLYVDYRGNFPVLRWQVTDFANLQRFIIERSLDSFRFGAVAVVGVGIDADHSWIDTLPKERGRLYYYRIRPVSACGTPGSPSIFVNGIKLEVLPASGGRSLAWNVLQHQGRKVLRYRLLRSLTPGDSLSWREVFSGADLAYFDPDSISDFGNTGICYRVLATVQDSVSGEIEVPSNDTCVVGDPLVFIPNAFHPAGINKQFRPNAFYVVEERSFLQIWNRWDQLIFTTSDLSTGWDGTDKDGNRLPEGLYLYRLTVVGFDLKERYFKGLVHKLSN